jgi:hypothetical protein
MSGFGMYLKVVVMIASLVWTPFCSNQGGVKDRTSVLKDAVISRGFVDDQTYRIVCKGYPMHGLQGLERIESSKRAALLHAYYVARSFFNTTVAPDRDGMAERFEITEDHAVVYYIIKKKNLRRRRKK